MSARFGPAHAFGNITIWIVLGDDELPAKAYMPLDDAIRGKHVTVHETGEVDKLRVEISGGSDVFIQAGDIVKGGRQDRVIRGDFVVSDGSMIVPAFCVEQGRWAQRGGEAEGSFSGSRSSIIGRKLKMAVSFVSDDPASSARRCPSTTTLGGSQRDVWKEVGAAQARLSKSLGHSVVSELSHSSLDLSLENQGLADEIARNEAALAPAGDQPDAIGFAYAIHGEPAGFESYGSRELFRSMWPKLLRAAITESLSEARTARSEGDACAYFERKLGELGARAALERHRTPRVRVMAREDDSAVLVETVDEKFGRVLHRRLIPKAA